RPRSAGEMSAKPTEGDGPVRDEGEPQSEENKERAERPKRRQATMFSTGKKCKMQNTKYKIQEPEGL
ncbi:MAG: hypothetical protein IK104_04665, partial [Clostridia bacterium]|nr:hypothetical protein [Clostridia bacterium]